MMRKSLFVFLGFVVILSIAQDAVARDAAFLSLNTRGSNKEVLEAIGVEPKKEVMLGETTVNVGRRTTAFFVNLSANPVKIVSVTSNGDANVRSEIVEDDCTKLGVLAVGSRCSVSVELTALSPGIWTAELMLTHKGAGRLARLKISGKTGGATSDKQKETGLELSSKDINPVDFSTVEVGTDRAVRTALMVNDSNDIIEILSVEVIASDNGLRRFEQGCTIGETLKPGESCPVTLVWKPEAKGVVSTDLIIRHSGKRGFSVIPIRGKAYVTEGSAASIEAKQSNKNTKNNSSPNKGIPLSPTASELESMIKNGAVLPVSEGDLASSGYYSSGSISTAQGDPVESLHLIGTVGNRAVFYLHGATFVKALGEKIRFGKEEAQIMSIMPREAQVKFMGKKTLLSLESVAILMKRAKKKQNEKSEKVIPDDKKIGPVPIPKGQ